MRAELVQDGARRRTAVTFARVLGDDRHDINIADYNVGLRYLAAVAERCGAAAKIMDPYDPEDDSADDPLLGDPGDIIGFTVHHLNVEHTLRACRRLKAAHPDVYIVLGGHHASATAEEILRDVPAVDAVCVGEGEDVVAQLVQAFAASQEGAPRAVPRGVLRPSRYVDVGELPFAPPPAGARIARMSTSRGCPYSCSFCTTPGLRKLLQEPVYRARSIEQIVQEMEYLHALGASSVRLNDDLYIVNSRRSHARALGVADALIQRALPVSYKAEFRVDSFGLHNLPELVKLRRSGLTEVFLGIESGSDAILKEYNKSLTVAESLGMLRLFEQAGIVVNAGNILASPDSTVESICDSIDGFRRMKLAYLFFRRITFRAHVFPGTELERRLDREGRLERKPRYLGRDYSFKDGRIQLVLGLFEEAMPEFLQEIGGGLFESRKKLITRRYDGLLDEGAQAALSETLSLFNEASAAFLTRWFRDLPASSLHHAAFRAEWDDYCAKAEGWRRSLLSLLDPSARRWRIPA